MAPGLTIAAVVCVYTLDRWPDIQDALASLDAQEHKLDEVVLVVDHNPELYDRLSSTYPELTVVENKYRRGLSGARNTGTETTSSDIIAFLDDDASAAVDWSLLLIETFDDPAVMGAGGSAEPIWPTERPDWFPHAFGWVIGCSFSGQPSIPTPVRNVLGCNMAFRREAFDLVGGFNEDIGRVGKTPLGCEETEFCIRVRQASPGAIVIYDPRVSVRHRVSANRTKPGYFLKRCYAEGLSKAMVTETVGAQDGLDSERRYVRSVLPKECAQSAALIFSRRPARAARAVWIAIGLTVTIVGFGRGKVRVLRTEHSTEHKGSTKVTNQ